MARQKPDYVRAEEIIFKFVLEAPYRALWESMIHDLIRPMKIEENCGPLDGYIQQEIVDHAAAGIRQEFPQSANSAEIWNSRQGAWCKTQGVRRIIEIVEKTAFKLSI